MKKVLFALCTALVLAAQPASADSDKLAAVLAAQPDEAKARYEYRHPHETIEFFGIEPGMTVLDLGSGTGILAIAALKLGASHAVCVDIEAQAVETARSEGNEDGADHAFCNHCSMLAELDRGEAEKDNGDGRFD